MQKNLLFLLLALPAFLFAQNNYHYSVSLVDSAKDKHLHVSLVPPTQTSAKVEFSLPKIVPGTYSISDFGRFVENFTVYNAKGEKIKTDSVNVNTFAIDNTNGISKIEYDLKDTYSAATGKSRFGKTEGVCAGDIFYSA